MPSPHRARTAVAALWSIVALVVVAQALFLAVSLAPAFELLPPKVSPDTARRVVRSAGPWLLAGSGSNLALTRALVAACTPAGAVTPTVAESIGSTGGVRALLDGAIDGALVSRPLRPAELRSGLQVLPYARVPVVLAAHPDTPPVDWRSEDLLAAFGGQQARWPRGQPLVVFQREPGDSSHLAVARALPAFAQVDADNARTRRWRTLYHDAAMLRTVTHTPDAVGLSDLATIRLQGVAVALLTYNGVQPGAETVRQGAWPFYKDLSLILTAEAPAELRQLAACMRGPPAQPVLRRAEAVGL